jgi:hypothetical protein
MRIGSAETLENFLADLFVHGWNCFYMARQLYPMGLLQTKQAV